MKAICIKCDVEMYNYSSNGLQPDGGTHFYTTGHYGSAITDHMDGTVTSLCVCDPCLQIALDQQKATVFYPTTKDNKEKIMSQNFELAAKEVVFHFNKGHLADPDIPMWVIKCKGKSYYVNHVTCELPWTTKETPNNSHTKGSLKVKNCYVLIDDDNHAYLKELTPEIKERLENPQKIIRVITSDKHALINATDGINHGTIKQVGGACSTQFYITEFYSDEDYVMFKLTFNSKFTEVRELLPNEDYYKLYSKYVHDKGVYLDEDDWFDDDEENEDIPSKMKSFLNRLLP